MPRSFEYGTVAAISGDSIKFVAKETIIDTGSWLSNVKECDKLWGNNYDYSFLKPITKQEFYSYNFDYPIISEG